MGRMLDRGAPCPPPSPDRQPPHCDLLTAEQMNDVDDMAAFIDAVKTEVRAQFMAIGFGNTAAGELADLHIGATA
jgi:hypothetical protein